MRGDRSRTGAGPRGRSIPASLWRQAGAVSLWVLIALGMLGGLVLYWYTTPQDAPSWVRDWLPGLPEYTGPLYRWRDDEGREHITDKPPRGRPYDTVTYRSDANVVPARGK